MKISSYRPEVAIVLIATAVWGFGCATERRQATAEGSELQYDRDPTTTVLRTGMPLEKAIALLLHRGYPIKPVVGLSILNDDTHLHPPSFYVPKCADEALIMHGEVSTNGCCTLGPITLADHLSGPRGKRTFTPITEYDLGPHKSWCGEGNETACWK